MRPSAHIYRASPAPAKSSLRQGEILSNIRRFRIDPNTLGTDNPGIQFALHDFAIVLTQDCDLEQDFKVRSAGNRSDKLLPNVLFCNLAKAEDLRGTAATTGISSDMWKRISQNKDERYHFLQAVDGSCDAQQIGLPELGLDFKRYFTLPTDELYHRIDSGEAKRRCILVSPYLEHLSNRFAHFLCRVALPEDHLSEPAALG